MIRRRAGWVRGLAWLGSFLVALSLVVWRQSAGVALERDLRSVEAETAVIEAERYELVTTIRALEARSRIVPHARSELGMRMPTDEEVMILPIGRGFIEAPLADDEGGR